MKRILLLTNPYSARGGQSIQPAREVFADYGIDCIHEPLGDDRSPQDILSHLVGRIDAVVVGGGDGTLNTVAPAIVDSGLPLGLLPLGTANDFARSLSIPTDPAAAAKVIGQGETARVFPARVKGRYCFNAVNIGLGARVRRHTHNLLKRIWGYLSYAIALYFAYRDQTPFRAWIRSGDE